MSIKDVLHWIALIACWGFVEVIRHTSSAQSRMLEGTEIVLSINVSSPFSNNVHVPHRVAIDSRNPTGAEYQSMVYHLA